MTDPPDSEDRLAERFDDYHSLTRDGIPPLQQPEFTLGRNHLSGLIIQSSGTSPPRPPKVQARRASANALNNPHMRYLRLIGQNSPRYDWEEYRKNPEELKGMKGKVREYYERTNALIDRYIYIDKLLDSTLPRDLLQTYQAPEPIQENQVESEYGTADASSPPWRQLKKCPSTLCKIVDEETALLGEGRESGGGRRAESERIVKIAIYVNLFANTILLISKVIIALLTSSLSVLASLVDAALDFLSTAIVWTTTHLIERKDHHAYPIGRARLEPLGVLVFSVIMVTSFLQVGLASIQRLFSDDHTVIKLSPAAIAIMAGTVVIKGACWLWCRMVKNSSVQALAQDAFTDVIFNIFSILFPLLGFYLNLWQLDALGGLILALYVVVSWTQTSAGHIANLTGAASSPDERNALLYLTMRFARSFRKITNVQAYHVGDRLNVEVDVVMDEGIGLRDSHDLGESLTYILESLEGVDRAYIHLDYFEGNPPGHLR
ncbi:hypothetical protein RUND412_001572 [Rhizina undulata]